MICCPRVHTSVAARSTETPGFNRATTASVFPMRLVSGVSGNGTNRSIWLAGANTDEKSKVGGSTATTVTA